MDILRSLPFMFIQGIFVGTCGIMQKKAQKGRIDTVMDTFVYTTFIAAFQLILYLIIPPYQALPKDPAFYAYTGAFSVGFFIQYLLLVLCLKLGPASMTSTMKGLNMLVPITLGLFIWNEPLTWRKGIGVMVFVVAIILMNKGSYSEGLEQKKFSAKWLVAAIAMLLLSGCCASISKQVMRTIDNVQKVYLLMYNVMVLIMGLPFCIIHREKTLALLKDKHFLLSVLLVAVFTAGADIIYVNFVPKFDTAFYLPLCSTLSIVASMVMGRLLLKEKVTGRALIAVGFCIIAVVILS